MKRILIPNHGSQPDNVGKAFAIAIQVCKSMGYAEFTIITPVKDNLDTTPVGDFLGEKTAKNLMKGDLVAFGNHGVNMRHESVSTVQKVAVPRVGIAFYLSEKDIQQLDGLRVDCLIFVPWADDVGVVWAAKWDAKTIGATTQGSEIQLPQDVIDALAGLTGSVNLSTGLGHPSDKEHAKTMFSNLRSRGLRWDPAEVEKWAARNNWRPKDAEKLAELSARYLK